MIRSTYNCRACGKECRYKHSSMNIYCNRKCSYAGVFLTTLERASKGLISERATLRKVLSHLRGYTCSECNISNYNNKPITLQVDHIDGNAGDNNLNNLRLICPNCHSQSENFGGANKGNGRAARGLKLR